MRTRTILAAFIVGVAAVMLGTGGCLSFPAWCETAKDVIEIVDLATGERVSLPYRDDALNYERLAVADDANERFYTIRKLDGRWSIRTISYSGEVLQEKELVGIYGGHLSDDGQTVAHLGRDLSPDLWIYNVATDVSTEVIPELPSDAVFLAWIGDSQLLVATQSHREATTTVAGEFFRFDVKTLEKETLYQDDSIYSPIECALSPDRKKLAFVSRERDELRILDLQAGEAYIAARGVSVDYDNLHNSSLQWSPDSAYVAYYDPLRSLVEVHSVRLQKNVVSKSTLGIGGMVSGLYFLDATRVTLEVSEIELGFGPSGIPSIDLVALDFETGEFNRPFPWKFRGTGHPIAGGTKLLCFVDDDRDYFAE